MNRDPAVPQSGPKMLMRLAPIPHFGGGVIPRIDIDKRAGRSARKWQFQVEIPGDAPGRAAVNPMRQPIVRHAVMRTEPNLLILGREPFELWALDHVIERQEPPEIDGQAGVSSVPDVGNPQLPVDALVGDPADARAVPGADDGNGLVHGKAEVHEALNEARRSAVMHIEIIGVLRAGEHAAVEADHRNPLGVFLAPPELFECFFPATQMSNHGGCVATLADGGR